MTLATRTTEPQPPRRSIWPYAIIAYFIVFAAAMVTWIVYASRQRMDLVNNDYYSQEILFQHQIDAKARADGKAEVAYDTTKQLITIQLPNAQRISDGEIRFYRPNDARLDHNMKLALNTAGAQQLDSRQLASGLWKLRVMWKADGADHYADKSIIVTQPKS